MKIRILKNTVADAKCVSVNDVVDISEKNARYLIALGKAEVFTEVEAKATAKAEPVIETVDTLPDEPSEPSKKRKGKI